MLKELNSENQMWRMVLNVSGGGPVVGLSGLFSKIRITSGL
jgi:hypothetical protein